MEINKPKRKLGVPTTFVGDKFGENQEHEILEIYYKYQGKKRTFVKISCPCGEEHITDLIHLKEKNRAICNCDYTGYFNNKKYDKDLIDKRFNSLTIKEIVRENHKAYCICLCDCGNEKKIRKIDVIKHHTKSCGCLWKEMMTEVHTKDWTGVISDWGVKLIKQYKQKDDIKVWLWECECLHCGDMFVALPSEVMNGHICSCGCAKMSSWEVLIRNMLDDNNVNFIPQYTFDDCTHINKLKFDFALFDENKNLLCLIEYDGLQHEMPIDFFGGDEGFELTKIRDSIKNKYCQESNIPLYRINYTYSVQDIKEEIKNILNTHKLL